MEVKLCSCGKIVYCKNLCKYHYNKQKLNRLKQKEYCRRWLDKNKEYFKDYYLIKKQELYNETNI